VPSGQHGPKKGGGDNVVLRDGQRDKKPLVQRCTKLGGTRLANAPCTASAPEIAAKKNSSSKTTNLTWEKSTNFERDLPTSSR
jgi:hypothetical protein